MKRIFMIDWGLLPSFILSVYTGIELHVAGHGNNHEIWHDWAIFHVIVSLLLLILIVLHIITHRNWYKGIYSSKYLTIGSECAATLLTEVSKEVLIEVVARKLIAAGWSTTERRQFAGKIATAIPRQTQMPLLCI